MTCTGIEHKCNCGKCPDCKRCMEPPVYRVKLGYVADNPTAVQLTDLYGSQIFDFLPIVQAGETDTSLRLLADTRRIRYYPEKYTRTDEQEGCFYDICIPDIAALINLNELGNVEDATPATGDVLIYNAATGQYEMYNLEAQLDRLDNRIDDVESKVDNINQNLSTINQTLSDLSRKINNLYELNTALSERVTNLETALGNRIKAIEDAIYNWANDKTTAIPRGTINITSGGYTSDNIIQSRAKNQDNDLNFE